MTRLLTALACTLLLASGAQAAETTTPPAPQYFQVPATRLDLDIIDDGMGALVKLCDQRAVSAYTCAGVAEWRLAIRPRWKAALMGQGKKETK